MQIDPAVGYRMPPTGILENSTKTTRFLGAEFAYAFIISSMSMGKRSHLNTSDERAQLSRNDVDGTAYEFFVISRFRRRIVATLRKIMDLCSLLWESIQYFATLHWSIRPSVLYPHNDNVFFTSRYSQFGMEAFRNLKSL